MKVVKIIGSIFLIVALLFATVGISYSVHFCKGKMAQVTLYPELQTQHEADCCGTNSSCAEPTHCSKPALETTNCCKNVSVSQKLVIQTVFSQIEKKILPKLIVLPFLKIENTIDFRLSKTTEIQIDVGKTMQPITNIPIFLSLCRLLIPS